MANELMHKAVNLSAVKVARRKELSQPGYLLANYEVQYKYDGCACLIFITATGGISITSRTGEVVRSMMHVAGEAMQSYMKLARFHGGIVVFGEAWIPLRDFSYTSGKFRQHDPAHELLFIAYDFVTQAEYDAGRSDRAYSARRDELFSHTPGAGTGRAIQPATFAAPGIYSYQESPDALVDMFLAANPVGYDGLIARDPGAPWVKGSGTGGEIIKLKRVLSFDLRVTGVEEGQKANADKVGALVVDFGGKALRVGTGLDNAQRVAWFENPDLIIGKIVQIDAMDYSSEGLLREPRLIGIRDDKTEPDDPTAGEAG